MVRLIATSILVAVSLSTVDALANFYKPGKVPENIKPQGYDRGRAAALEIPSRSDEMGCSATIISNQGHILTALHCIPQCVKLQTGKAIKSFQYLTPDRQQILSRKANCSLPFAQEGRNFGSMKAQVIAAGVGYVAASKYESLREELDKDVNRRAVFVNLMKAGIGIPGDFAILYVPGLANRTCAKAANRSPRLAESVWYIGYPSSRTGAAFSYGQVNQSLLQTNYDVKNGTEAANLRTRRSGMFVSLLSAATGSSGSGVQSYEGELMGVLNAANANMTGGAYASSIDYIKQYTAANFGASVVAQAFNCQ